MKSIIEPYLTFNGRCEEALKFYQTALGAELQMMMRFKESPQPPPASMMPPDWGEKVCHATLKIGSCIVMASDGCGGPGKFSCFSLSISLNTEVEAGKVFAALGDGGKVSMPLTKTFWSPCFGMVEDRFGVSWMVTVNPVK